MTDEDRPREFRGHLLVIYNNILLLLRNNIYFLLLGICPPYCFSKSHTYNIIYYTIMSTYITYNIYYTITPISDVIVSRVRCLDLVLSGSKYNLVCVVLHYYYTLLLVLHGIIVIRYKLLNFLV